MSHSARNKLKIENDRLGMHSLPQNTIQNKTKNKTAATLFGMK